MLLLEFCGWLQGVAMQLIKCYYAAARVLWVVARLLLCGY